MAKEAYVFPPARKLQTIFWFAVILLSVMCLQREKDVDPLIKRRKVSFKSVTLNTVGKEHFIKSRAFQTNELSKNIVTEGNVDVALFTVRSNLVQYLPRTTFCSKWNRSITFRDARFNVSACKDADVVMFTSGRDFNRHAYWRELQAQRKPSQLWLMSTAEAPINIIPTWPPIHMRYMRMNLSSTYRSISEIPIPYGEYVPFQNETRVLFRERKLNDKEKLIVWVASHCPLRTWNRSGLVHDLSRYLPVDVYGKCGNLQCDDLDKRCIKVFSSYKFYLGLENSCCGEYITEKFWQPLMKFDAIPVVLGASKEDYKRVAPPNSFIHIDDFASVEDLANYIKTVASNLSLYQSYFEWKKHGYVRWNKVYKSVWRQDEHSCKLLEYVKGVRPLSVNGFDPYESSWFGSCHLSKCGTRQWILDYYLYPFQNVYDRLKLT
ncbi:Glycoprotein 3-alpha-L-fucosyltransferase A [Holothuria leucospilota]|uniref:Fucosyltransferase n=1 Tax=Holothuria leucospilota TaxID=206669 RepID=A0A9Q1H521_HOLLE|nr:Glycoprotein 3-alpha-L-fucosyltransferase A [Holothuria leucospilota]